MKIQRRRNLGGDRYISDAAKEVGDESSDLISQERFKSSNELYLEAAMHFLDVQISTLDVLDNKTAQSFSVGSVVLPVTFALLNLSDSEIPNAVACALSAALGFYVLLLIFAVLASMVRGLEYRPDIPTLKRNSIEFSGDVLQRWIADEYEQSSVANKRVLIKKARWVGAATVTLYLEALALSFAAIGNLLL